MRAFAGKQWWVLGRLITPVIVLTALSLFISARRDLGSGLLANSAGPAEAAVALNNAVALAWRLHRATLFSWIVGAILFALALGSVSQSLTVTVGSQLTTWMNQVQVRDQGDALLRVLIYAFGLSLLFFAFQSALFCAPKKLLCVQT